MLVYTEKGWLLEREIYANEILECIFSNPNKEDVIKLLNTTNREVKLLMLKKIEDSHNSAYISF